MGLAWQYKHIYQLFIEHHTSCHHSHKYGHSPQLMIVQSCIIGYQKHHQSFEDSDFTFIVGQSSMF